MVSCKHKAQSRFAMRIVFGFCGLLVFVCLAFVGIGVHEVLNQQRLVMSHSATTTADVLAQRLERHEYDSMDHPGRTIHVYKPIITFRYEVEGQECTGNKVFPDASATFSYTVAQSLLDRFAIGTSTTAYYNPDNPTDACLIRRPLLEYYCGILIPMIVVFSIVGVFWRSSQPADVTFKRWKGRWIAAVWHSIGLLACGHYLYVSCADISGSAILLFGVYTQVGLIPVCSALPPAKGGSIVNRFKVAVGFSLVGTFLGFLLGLGMGWVATTLFSASQTAFLQTWAYSIGIFAVLLFSLGATFGSD